MKKIVTYLLAYAFLLVLWLRYRIKVVGYEKLNAQNLNKSGGVLFLPNHPAALVDPAVATLAVFPKFPIRPMVVEYMYFTPIVHSVMKLLDALPVPNFESSNNSLKRKRHEMVINEVVKGLKNGQNFLLYPAGRLKHTGIEKIGGASAAHTLIQQAPEANIVLVRIKGLWGSSFSRAFTGKVPPLFPTLRQGLLILLKNLIFFTPKRDVTVELDPAPPDFPYHASRLELNQWLENWYNQPDGLSERNGEAPGDTLKLVSYSFWKKDIPQIFEGKAQVKEDWKVADIPKDVQEKVIGKLMQLTELHFEQIKPSFSLSSDLGLDSLDTSELAMYIQDTFETGPVPVTEMTTVERVMAIASGKIKLEEAPEEEQYDLSKWTYDGPSVSVQIAEGDTIPEVFLNMCGKMGKKPAVADARSGVLSYERLKLGAIVLAEKIRKMPGKYIGILLPSSVGATLTLLACQLAGKVPLMINWTIGPRHLDAVRQLSKVETVLTSWAFLERLDQVDLSGIDDKLVMLETLRREISLFDKIKALILSKRSPKAIMHHFGIDKRNKHSEAVLLFTSGSEAMPKGVPLSHYNILWDQRAALNVVKLYTDDVLFAVLPPFHSFGFCLTSIIGILSGMRTAFFPNPTDGKGMARACELWQATITCGAPTFIRAMLKAGTPQQLKTMRLCVTGAEKTPPELLKLLDAMGKRTTHVEGYGLTECAPILTANKLGMPQHGVGQPLEGIELLVIHPDTYEPLPIGKEGLVLARGPNIFAGYINPGQKSPFVSVQGKEWYVTGDIGSLDTENFLTISGRKKRFIKVGGEMVSLEAIEKAIVEAAKDKGWTLREEGPSLGIIAKEKPGEKPFLCLVTTFNTTVDEVNMTLRQHGFSNIVRVSDVVTMEEIPVMGTGKINYRFLEEEYFDRGSNITTKSAKNP